jgi:hypothetical protein
VVAKSRTGQSQRRPSGPAARKISCSWLFSQSNRAAPAATSSGGMASSLATREPPTPTTSRLSPAPTTGSPASSASPSREGCSTPPRVTSASSPRASLSWWRSPSARGAAGSRRSGGGMAMTAMP